MAQSVCDDRLTSLSQSCCRGLRQDLGFLHTEQPGGGGTVVSAGCGGGGPGCSAGWNKGGLVLRRTLLYTWSWDLHAPCPSLGGWGEAGRKLPLHVLLNPLEH